MMKPVLVVEDERDLRETMADLLESEGYRVVQAGDGREALAVAHEAEPCLIVLDLMMPVMSGWEVMEAMAHDRQLADTPVVIVSASHHPPPGARAFLPKPFEIDELLGVVQRLAGGSRSHPPPPSA